jgi:hypothetical protein
MPSTSQTNPGAIRQQRVDAALTALLVLQGVTLFAVIPLGARSTGGRILLDLCHFSFAAVSVAALTRRRLVQGGVIAALALLAVGPSLSQRLGADLQVDVATQHELVAMIAFAFNAAITALIARHVFSSTRVTVHRVRGAILLYLNVAALFAIAYGALEQLVPGAFQMVKQAGEAPTAAFTYFSLTTITTVGYGDITPLHPLARSLATLEAVFGQLFPATLLARLVALHLAHEQRPGDAPD